MKIIDIKDRQYKHESTLANVTHHLRVVQLIIDPVKKNTKDSEIEDFYASNLTMEMKDFPAELVVEVANACEYGLVGVVVELVATYYDGNKSPYRNTPEANTEFFRGEILVPIESIGLSGHGSISNALKSNGYHYGYVKAHKAAR